MSLRALFLALTFGAALHPAASSAAAQQIGSRLILASAQDADGRQLVDIDLDDFVVHEAGQPRDVLSSRVADYPIALVLDNSRGASRDFDAIRRAAVRFIERVGHRPIAIASTSPPRMIATFEDDRATVMKRMDQIRKSSSQDGLFAALVAAARAAQETGASFSAVVLVVNNPAGTVPADLLAPIRESGANVHMVIQQRTSSRVDEQQKKSIAELVDLVDATRGELITVFGLDAFQLALDRLANKLATEVMVEYVVPAGSSIEKDVKFGVRGARVSNWGVSAR